MRAKEEPKLTFSIEQGHATPGKVTLAPVHFSKNSRTFGRSPDVSHQESKTSAKRVVKKFLKSLRHEGGFSWGISKKKVFVT